MKTKTVRYNSSLNVNNPVYKFKLQIKRGNRWVDIRSNGVVISTAVKEHCNNIGLKLNPHHKCA